MWARISEIFFALWLFISPWVFGSSSFFQEGVFSFFIFLFSALSFIPKWSRMHLANLIVGLVLLGLTLLQRTSLIYAVEQNRLIISLFLFLFGIIPSDASSHPSSWIEFYEKKIKE